jgi:hypothetical protein
MTGTRPTGATTAAPAKEPAAESKPGAEPARPLNVETAETLLAQFFGQPLALGDTRQTIVERVRPAAVAAGYTVDTLIVTVPDPIDSHSRWQFDPIQNALQRAASRDGFVLDRFYIPDWKPWTQPKDAAKERSRLHESWPGVILFRDKTDKSARLLVAFLVFETPTQGIHLEAFANAADFIHAWQDGAPTTLKILGPTFSGSSPSLQIALRNLVRDNLLPGSSIRVVTGTATSLANKAIIESADSKRVTFEATVLSNRDMLVGIIRHLRSSSRLMPGQLALLVEENTGYGQSAKAAGEVASDLANKDDVELLDGALRIGFPLHVSRLRAGADRTQGGAPASNVAAASRMQALSLKDEGLITDQIPLFGEPTTPAYVELLLVNILQTLRREHVTTVGLFATDTRDKLFLAQMLARYCPDVRVFTIETDLLYAHPDYSTYMRGAVVAATYPLFNANQLWTLPGLGELWRWQFATSPTQGVYNAFHVVMRGPTGVDMEKLAEYSMPFQTSCERGCAPPLWITVNGRAGLWPLEAVPAESSYVYRVHGGGLARLPADRARMLSVPTWAIVTLVLLHAGIWIQIVAYLIGSKAIGRLNRRCPPMLACTFARAAGPRRYLLSAFTSLFLVVAFADLLVWIGVTFVYQGSFRIRALTATALAITLAALVAVMIDIARRRWPTLRAATSVPGHRAGFGAWMLAYRILFLALLGAMVWHLCSALLAPTVTLLRDGVNSESGRALVFFFIRSVNLTNGVSPAVPVMLLCGALYLWGFQHFRTRGVPSRSVLRKRLAELEGLRAQRSVTALRGAPVVEETSGPSLDRLALIRFAVFAGFVLVQAFWYSNSSLLDLTGVTTIESVAFTKFFQYASILLQALVAVSIAQFLFVWGRTRRRLECFIGMPGLSGPLSKAFSRLPVSLRSIGVFTQVPRLRELDEAVVRAEAIQRFSLEVVGFPRGSDAILARQPEFQLETNCPTAADVRAVFDLERKSDASQTFSDTQTWDQLLRFTGGARARAAAIKDLVDHHPSGAVQVWLEHVDNLIALDIAFIVREVSGRLVASMVLTLGLTLMVLASHTWYPAQPRQVLMGFSWACILASVAASLRVFIQIDRNEIISYITGTRVNRVNWDLAFVSKLLLWVVIPLLSLFAAQFPEAGSALLQWVQPVQSALP